MEPKRSHLPDDRDDFQGLALPLERDLYARALGLERSPQDAWDLVQDTFERALRSFDQFRPGTNIKQWMFRIMYNLFVDRYRRRAHELALEPAQALNVPAPEPEPEAPWETLAPSDFDAALRDLEPPFRQVLVMHFQERRSYKEISLLLGIRPATVGTRLLRARGKLRTLLAASPGYPHAGENALGTARVQPALSLRGQKRKSAPSPTPSPHPDT